MQTDNSSRPDAPERSALEQLSNDPSSRKRFFKMAGGVGAAGSMAAFLAACGSGGSSTTATATPTTPSATVAPPSTTPPAAMGSGDVAIVNYALTLEYLETSFYQKVVSSGLLKGAELTLAKHFGEEEAEHVAALTAAVKNLGGTPVAQPQTVFPLKSRTAVLQLAATVENLGAAAYLGQAGNIKSKEILAAALSIHSVEARHAATLNKALGLSVTPDGAFAKPASMQAVLKAVQPFIKG
jgi:hypothetical protein